MVRYYILFLGLFNIVFTQTPLDIKRLSSLIELKYKSLHDGQKVLGDADNIKNTFINFQKHLY